MTENNFQIDSAVVSDRGLSEKRPQNEDSFLELNERGLFVVADGVGGAQAGDVASQMAVEILGEAFINLQKSGDAEDIMRIAVERANEAIFQMSHDLAQLSTMATTVVALHVAGNIATIGHVGDSRLYRLDPKGNFYRETQDHSVVEEEVRAGRMTEQQAANHPSRNVISRALGADHTVEVDMKTIMIEPNTTFLLCSDGITRHIDDFQLREILLFNDTPENLCRRMKEICYERGAEDNLTAVIARISDRIVGKNAAEKTPLRADFEESTVAAVRPPSAVETAAEETFVEEDESPTQPLVMPIAAPQTFESNRTTSEDFSTPAAADKPIVPVPRREIVETANDDSFYSAPADDPNTTSGKMSRLLSSILFLLLGGIIGAGVYYLFARNNAPPPTTSVANTATAPQPSPTNKELAAFEESRRLVDENPNAYINTNANLTQDAEGLYLVGRAYLLTGKYPEAKKFLEQAKDKLGQSNQVNSRVLNFDIALGLSIIDDWRAQNRFQNQVNAGANTNTQGNSKANMELP